MHSLWQGVSVTWRANNSKGFANAEASMETKIKVIEAFMISRDENSQSSEDAS